MKEDNAMNALLRAVRSIDPLERPLGWQVRTTALAVLVGPPSASLFLLTLGYLEYGRAVGFDLPDFLVAFALFAIPVGYAFGAAPALFAASLYCALLARASRWLQRRPLARAGVGAICGGVASLVWFSRWVGSALGAYGLMGALVMAALSLVYPSNGRHGE